MEERKRGREGERGKGRESGEGRVGGEREVGERERERPQFGGHLECWLPESALWLKWFNFPHMQNTLTPSHSSPHPHLHLIPSQHQIDL